MTISISINYLNFEYLYRKYKKVLTNLGTNFMTISISINYIKRVNRFMNSVFWFIQLGSYTFYFILFYFIFLQAHLLVWAFFFIYFFYFFYFYNISIFICLHCRYTKSGKYYTYLHTKKVNIVQILQVCTKFSNFYVSTI